LLFVSKFALGDSAIVEGEEASRPQVQAILTPKQQQKFAQMKEEAKERRGEMKDKGHSDSQPPQ
jgi:Spy/CpxP family protein refolding chaperone